MIISNNGNGANIRTSPAGALARASLSDGTAVQLLNAPAVDAVLAGVKYTWNAVLVTSDNTVGWVANRYIAADTPSPQKRRTIGVHVLQDAGASSQQLVSKLASGITLPSVTVLNDFNLVKWWALYAKYVVFRHTPDELTTIPDDQTIAFNAGQKAYDDRAGWITQLPTNVYPIPCNEIKWGPGHNAFWLGWLQQCNAHGRKACIGAYGVGQPEVTQWQAMVSALSYCKSAGNLVILHSYCQRGTAPGMLSADGADFEFRHVELFNAVLETARPLLVISEDGHEYDHGEFEGATPFITYSDKLQQHDQQFPYVISRNKYTLGSLGGWAASSIDSAVGALANFINDGRYP